MTIVFTCLFTTAGAPHINDHHLHPCHLATYINIDTLSLQLHLHTSRVSTLPTTTLHIPLSLTGDLQPASSKARMATLNDPALGDTTEDVVLGPKTLKDTKKHLAQFFSGDLDSDDDGPVRKKKRKAVLDEGDEEDEEPATTTKRKKRSEPESTAERKLSLSQRLSKPPTALSRPMQKKLDHSMKQQAFYRSGVQARPGRLLQNAVFKKIAELETKADKKRLKKTERTKGLGDTQDEQLLPNEPIEVQNKDDEIMTGSQVNNLQQSSTKKAMGGQTKGSQGKEIAGDGGGEDCLLQVKEPKEGQKKKKKGLEPTYVDSLRETYINDLRSLSMELPTRHQAAALESSTSGGPKYLGRTASTVHGHRHSKQWKTNGSTSQDLLLPSADTRPGFESHPNLTDLSQGQIIYMCGHHLTWLDPKHDEFLSYSKDLLFLLVHALGRHHTGQRNVTIQYINREESTSLEGEPALFYDALAIYNIFEVPSWSGWTNYLKHALNPRKFTHEFLSHGIVKHNDATLKQAGLEDLIRDGLFELFPELEAPENHRRCGLYTEQVVCRRHGYPPPKPSANQPNPPIYSYEKCSRAVALTKKILRIARKLALNFITVPAGTDLEMIEPPLHIFLQFLTLHKRGKADPILLAWIQQRYNGKIERTPLIAVVDSQGERKANNRFLT